MQSAIILIPVHKKDPSNYELISFDRCFSIFKDHSIIKLLAPEGLDLSAYTRRVKNLRIIRVAAHHLNSLGSYNKMKISHWFYSLFQEYEYLLTYELDSYVFKDELQYWCDKKYDYIGAPWLEGFHDANDQSALMKTGNSGFSLRNVQTCISICRKVERFSKTYSFLSKISGLNLNCIKSIFSPFAPLFNCFATSEFFQAISNNLENDQEDYFWCVVVPKFHQIKIAPVEEAVAFSFEVQPARLFKINKEVLPFGCHAWWRYDKEFWSKYISIPNNMHCILKDAGP